MLSSIRFLMAILLWLENEEYLFLEANGSELQSRGISFVCLENSSQNRALLKDPNILILDEGILGFIDLR